jgi:hypothetical protein
MEQERMMLVKIWRFITIMLTALPMGMAFCHLLEMPAKMTYDGALWLTLLQTLYGLFGPVGAIVESGAVVMAVALAFLVRQRRPAFGWTLVGAFFLMGRSGERCNGTAKPGYPAGPLDGAAQPMGIPARRTRGPSNYRTGCNSALCTR